MKKLLTLCIVHHGDKVLLGMKKRGFGAGRWNGFGGKLNERESIEAATIRETVEEAFITPTEFQKLGVLTFTFENEPDHLETHVYKCTAYSGREGESEEMRPQWFSIKDIPFNEMWKDDIFWFPLFLANKKFIGKFHFDAQHELLTKELKEVANLN